MPAMLGLSMNGGRAPGTEVAALTEAEDDNNEEEVAVVVLVVGEEEEDEVGTAHAPPKPNRSGYMQLGSLS